MATLEKIRSKGPLLIIVVGLALLAFIIGDFLNSGATFFGKSRETIAKIQGESIHYTDYGAALDQMTEVYKIETGQSNLTEDIMDQIHSSVWESLISEKILYAQAEKVGITVTPEELSERLIGNNIHPIIAQRATFYDETGRFNRTYLIQFLNSLDQNFDNNPAMQAEVNKAKDYWNFWEKAVKNDILQEKYNNLISKAIVANSLDAKSNFEASKRTVDVNYVVQPYFSLPDSTVAVSNNEIKNRYNKNKEQYKQDDNCAISYVAFNIEPLKADFENVEAWINNLSEGFETTDNPGAFVNNAQSDVVYRGNSYSEKTVPAVLKDFAFSAKVGDVTDPIFHDNTYTMARVVETDILLPDSVKLRHIYLTDENISKEDSIVTAIRRGSSFAALASEFSAIPQTAANGGEIGWITESDQLDRELADVAFTKRANEVFTLKNAQGVQIFQVMERTAPRKKVKLAILERKVTPGSKTYNVIYGQAKQFAASVTDLASFNQSAQDSAYIVRPAENILKSTRKISFLPQSRPIVRWAFENKVGTVSDVFDCETQYVVAILTNVNKGGYQSIENVSNTIKGEIIKEKKGDLILQNISSKLETNKSLDALATALDVEVKEADGVNFSSFQFGGAGFEPAVIGRASSIAQNTLSSPIKGNAGVYVVEATNAVENTDELNVEAQKQELEMRLSYSLPYAIQQGLRTAAKIEDNRLNFY